MPNVPSVNDNRMQPRQQKRARHPTTELDNDATALPGSNKSRGRLARQDSVELSPEALEFLRRSREKHEETSS